MVDFASRTRQIYIKGINERAAELGYNRERLGVEIPKILGITPTQFKPITNLSTDQLRSIVNELQRRIDRRDLHPNQYSIFISTEPTDAAREKLECIVTHLTALLGHIEGVNVVVTDADGNQLTPNKET